MTGYPSGFYQKTVGGCPPISEGSFPSDLYERRAIKMITYEELFILIDLIVSIIALVVTITKKK